MIHVFSKFGILVWQPVNDEGLRWKVSIGQSSLKLLLDQGGYHNFFLSLETLIYYIKDLLHTSCSKDVFKHSTLDKLPTSARLKIPPIGPIF